MLHGQRYLAGQMLQARHWLDARPDDVVWCTAASGWSKSARNAFVAPWLRGAAALLHDARFDPHERLELLQRERVDLLCMAPTEYRLIAKREAAPPARPARRRRGRRGAQPRGARGLARGDRRVGAGRLRPDRDRPAHRHAARHPGAAGLDGHRTPACGSTSTRASSSPTPPRSPPSASATWARPPPPAKPERGVAHRRPRRARRAGFPVLRRPHRRRDHLGRLPDRPVRGRVLLVSHPAVAEAAVVAAPDDERGSVVRAVVVLRDGHEPSPQLAVEPRTTSRRDRALQVPADRRLRRRAASTDRQRKDPPGGTAITTKGPPGRRPFVGGGGNRWVRPGRRGRDQWPMILGGAHRGAGA